MIKELKYLFYTLFVLIFIFFTLKYYFSDINKKNSFRSLNNTDQKIILYSQNLPVLKNDTQDIIEYVKNTKNKKKKKYYFWELIN